MRLIPITSLDFPAVEPYRTLREKTQHWREGFFVAEGEKVFRRLVNSTLEIVSLLISSEWLETLSAELDGERFRDVDVFVGENDLLETIVGVTLHQKIMAIGRIPPEPDPTVLFSVGGFHVALEGIANAENMGTIARHCAAFGARSLITGRDATSPWLRRTVRVSMGTIFDVPAPRCDNILDSLRDWKTRFGLHLVGTTPLGGSAELARCLPRDNRHRPVCLLFGSEGEGLTDEAFAACDALYTIPMTGTADSLNVSTAVAITLFDFSRASST
jgi:tRNA G18 (ribose-2'-O)-methylase SpoU